MSEQKAVQDTHQTQEKNPMLVENPAEQKDVILANYLDMLYHPTFGGILKSARNVLMEKPFNQTAENPAKNFQKLLDNESYQKFLENVKNPERLEHYYVIPKVDSVNPFWYAEKEHAKGTFNFPFRMLPSLHTICKAQVESYPIISGYIDLQNKKGVEDTGKLDFSAVENPEDLINFKAPIKEKD